MRKEDVASFVVYIVMIALAVVIGFALLMPLMNTLATQSLIPFGNSFLFAAVVVIAAIVFNALLIEIGHLIGAKIGKYNIALFDVLFFAFYRKNGKMRFGMKNFDGLAGETKIIPKSEKSNPKPYLWFPILFYAIEILAVVLICMFVNNADSTTKKNVLWLVSASVIFASVGGLIILYDYIPTRLDSMTDGYRLSLLNKPVNKIAFNKMLTIEYDEFEGIHEHEVPVFDEITDFTASINIIKVYEYLSEAKYKESLELLNKIIADPKAINIATYNKVVAQILSIKLIVDDYKEVETYYTNIESYTRKFISTDYSMECVRAYLLVSGLIEGSETEVKFAMNKYEKAMKRTIEGRKEIEKKLYLLSLEKVKTLHPDFFQDEQNS